MPAARSAALDAQPMVSLGGPFRATLTDVGGHPLAGQLVRFRTGGRVRCTATTDARGVAHCGTLADLVLGILAGGYTAEHPGQLPYLPSTDAGPVV